MTSPFKPPCTITWFLDKTETHLTTALSSGAIGKSVAQDFLDDAMDVRDSEPAEYAAAVRTAHSLGESWRGGMADVSRDVARKLFEACKQEHKSNGRATEREMCSYLASATDKAGIGEVVVEEFFPEVHTQVTLICSPDRASMALDGKALASMVVELRAEYSDVEQAWKFVAGEVLPKIV